MDEVKGQLHGASEHLAFHKGIASTSDLGRRHLGLFDGREVKADRTRF